MADDDKEVIEKTDLEKSQDIITQMKEMQHYAKTNIERLTEQWLKMDGELKQKEMAKKMEGLLTTQNTFHDDLEAAITEYETLCEGMQPKV
ncbi:MAG: hypothetical protein ABIN96_12675 [Rubrivivax sp.]